jgi:hypothetical protein
LTYQLGDFDDGDEIGEMPHSVQRVLEGGALPFVVEIPLIGRRPQTDEWQANDDAEYSENPQFTREVRVVSGGLCAETDVCSADKSHQSEDAKSDSGDKRRALPD